MPSPLPSPSPSALSTRLPAATVPASPPVLRLVGGDHEVASQLAHMINGGWRFCAVPVLVAPGLWEVNARRGQVDPFGW